MNVLFVGNSYTYFNSLDETFEKLAKENGKDVCCYRVTEGGRKLVDYKNPNDVTTRLLKHSLEQRKYDVCFLQEQSLLPFVDYDRFKEGLDFVLELIGDRAEKIILYATWGRKDGSPELEKYGITRKKMTELLSDAYEKAAGKIGCTVSPVGQSFLTVGRECPDVELYHTDKSHPSQKGTALASLTHYYTVFLEAPTSLHCLGLSEEEKKVFLRALTK